MAIRKPENRDLPKNMKRRIRYLKSGRKWVGYYFDTVINGKRTEIPLGTDFEDTLIEWAKLTGSKISPIKRKKDTLSYLFDLYMEKIAPQRGHRTQKDYAWEIKQLRLVFEDVPIKSVKPHHIAQYRVLEPPKLGLIVK